MKRKPAARPRVPLLTVKRESAVLPALSPEATLGDLAELVRAVNQAADPVVNLRAWLATVEPVVRAAMADEARRPLAQLCTAGVPRVGYWLSRVALTGAEIASAMQDAAELAANVEALRVEAEPGPKPRSRSRSSAATSRRRAPRPRPAQPNIDSKWAPLAALAKTHNALGRTRDEILADLSKRSRMRIETIARHELIKPHLPAARAKPPRGE